MANIENSSDSKNLNTAENAKKHVNHDKLGETNGEQSKLATFYHENEKLINGIGIAILIIAILLVAYFKWLAPKWNNEAAENAQPSIAAVVQNATLSSDTAVIKAALEGDKDSEGLLSVIDSYDHFCLNSAKSAKFSLKYYTALCYMNMSRNDDALDLLLSMKKQDDYLWYEAQMLIGDLYDDKGDADNAQKYYENAAKGKTDFVAPIALWKLGMLCERNGDWAGAFENYQTVQDKYYERYSQMGIAKYYERAKIKAGK